MLGISRPHQYQYPIRIHSYISLYQDIFLCYTYYTFGTGTCNCELDSELYVWLMFVFVIWYSDVIRIVPVFHCSCTV